MAAAVLDVCQSGLVVRLWRLRTYGHIEEYGSDARRGLCMGARLERRAFQRWPLDSRYNRGYRLQLPSLHTRGLVSAR